MDQHTFDRLTRAVAAGQSRRAFLRRVFGIGAAAIAGGSALQGTLAAPVLGTRPSSTDPLREPSEPIAPTQAIQPQSSQEAICPEPLVDSECGCLDPETQSCCQDAVCAGDCTAEDGCCNVSSDPTDRTRGEVCGDYCCHPHLEPDNENYSECCDSTCCAGHCYGENLCCPVASYCPGAVTDVCCGADELCCGASSTANTCIPGGIDACCSVDDCTLETGACYVSCDLGVCRQHVCSEGAVCCADSAGNASCVAGNCCSDADCGIGEACLSGYCAPAECFADTDCAGADACTSAACIEGVCIYAAVCEGECATCADGICSTDDSLCGLCGVCDAGTCIPLECPEGYSCYAETGECLGVA